LNDPVESANAPTPNTSIQTLAVWLSTPNASMSMIEKRRFN
jgi:hypothetical protein